MVTFLVVLHFSSSSSHYFCFPFFPSFLLLFFSFVSRSFLFLFLYLSFFSPYSEWPNSNKNQPIDHNYTHATDTHFSISFTLFFLHHFSNTHSHIHSAITLATIMGGIISRLRQVHSLNNLTSLSLSSLSRTLDEYEPSYYRLVIHQVRTRAGSQWNAGGVRRAAKTETEDTSTTTQQTSLNPECRQTPAGTRQGNFYFLLYCWINTLRDDWRPNGRTQPARAER